MPESKFQFKQTINTYDSLPSGQISPISPLNYFQEVAQRQLEELGIGLEYLMKNHYAWVLVKYEITYHAYPLCEQEVIVETEPTGLNRFEAYRRFRIISESGEELISGKSVWVLINTETKRMIRITDVKEINENIIVDNPETIKIPRLERATDFDKSREFRVRYQDIDINHHVNNVKYISWAAELLPVELLEESLIRKITVHFKEQAYYNELVTVKSKQIPPNTYRIDVVNNEGKVLCELKIESREHEE